MITWKKAAFALLSAALLSSSMAPMAMAATRQKVGKINLTIDSNIRTGREGGDVQITPTGDNADLYYVDSWEIRNDSGDAWNRSNPPEIHIILEVEDDEEYYFDSSSSSAFKLTLGSSSKNRFYKVKYVDAERKSRNSTMTLIIQLPFDKDTDTSSAAAPANLRWSDGTALWNQVSSAKYYQVQLIRNGSPTGDIKDILDESYDFTSQITSAGTYAFKVRSIKSNNARSGWTTSSAWTADEETVLNLGNTPQPSGPTGNGQWVQETDGKWWWRNADNSYPASAWKEIDGVWYYFNADGYMETGWINLDGVFYYLDVETGAMYVNRRTPDNYWVNESGAYVPDM